MAFCVFMHRANSIYDDRPDVQYQFPKQYLARAKTCEGSWIVYLEPSKVRQSRGYFGIARVAQIIPDPGVAGMYLALIAPGSFLSFAQAVPLRDGDQYLETGLLNDRGALSGRAQAAVRPISAADFDRITTLGLDDTAHVLPRTDVPDGLPGLAEEPVPFLRPMDRVQHLTPRVVRDRVFRRTILRAYDERCAVTGLRLINGGGRAEVNASHIRPVEQGGPDIVGNGLALSGTAHWMFDRGLIGIADDLRILVSRQVNDHDSIEGMLNRTGHALAPARAADRAHPAFLEWHRSHVFKG
jgi:putative restriction endonuclease